MQCKTPVTISWVNPDNDWHWFWLRQITVRRILLTVAPAPDGTPHDGDSFWVGTEDIEDIQHGHIKPKFLTDWSPWRGLV